MNIGVVIVLVGLLSLQAKELVAQSPSEYVKSMRPGQPISPQPLATGGFFRPGSGPSRKPQEAASKELARSERRPGRRWRDAGGEDIFSR